MSDESIQLSTRIPDTLDERIEALVERIPPEAVGATSLNKSTVVRLALEQGVTALEKLYPAPTRARR